MALKKAKQGKKNASKNQVITYYFNVDKCKNCAKKNGCYKEDAKSKTYSLSIKSDIHKDQIEFEKSEYFRKCAKERYMIEAKNSEPKDNNQVKRIDIGLFLLNYKNTKHDISKNRDISCFLCSNLEATEKITIFSVASGDLGDFFILMKKARWV